MTIKGPHLSSYDLNTRPTTIAQTVGRTAALLLFLSTATLIGIAQDPAVGPQLGSARIVWSTQTGVETYRLQIASDETFQDVLLDRLIDGVEFSVTDLVPGYYYYRVALQLTSGSVQFLEAVRFEVKRMPLGSSLASTVTPPRSPAENKTRTRLAVPGWSVATGRIVNLMSAQLRAGSTSDFVGVNSDGTVYALDAARGIALWTARFDSVPNVNERVRVHYNNFTPLTLSNTRGTSIILVAFNKGVRALEGSTGREIWSTQVAGIPTGGVVIGNEIYLTSEKRNRVLVIDSKTGQLKRKFQLKDKAVGPPIVLEISGQRQLLVPMRNYSVEVRALEGKHVRTLKLGAEVTAQPVVVPTPKGPVLLIGLKNGVVAFDAASLQALGRTIIDDNSYPVGRLSPADLDGDQVPEVVLISSTGRVLAIDVIDGKVKWSVDCGGSSTPSFVDLDADSRLDVVLAGKKAFAIGLSGLTGAVIWEGRAAKSAEPSGDLNRLLALVTVTGGKVIVAGSDAAAAGLRALEVPQPLSKSNR